VNAGVGIWSRFVLGMSVGMKGDEAVSLWRFCETGLKLVTGNWPIKAEKADGNVDRATIEIQH
jgi:hypothetical protein